MYSKNNRLAIYSLIVFFVLFNIYFAKMLNILIFIAGFIVSKQFTNNINSLLIGSLCGMFVGIIKNFHLLENFEEQKPENDINTALLNNYINENQNIISEREVKISDLKPTKSKISSKKINEMKGNSSSSSPRKIIVTNDNHIIKGHHEWYIKSNEHFNTEKDQFVKCVIIDKNINKFLEDIKQFKHLVNKNVSKGFQLDRNELENIKSRVNRMKDDIEFLKTHVDNFSKMKFV